MVEDAGPRALRTITGRGLCGPSSPFRRRTTVHEELASYIECLRRAEASTAFAAASHSTREATRRGPDRTPALKERLRKRPRARGTSDLCSGGRLSFAQWRDAGPET